MKISLKSKRNRHCTSAYCARCDEVLISQHHHDFVSCSCGEVFVDGGDEYGRGSLSKYLIPLYPAAYPYLYADPVL